MYQKSLNKALFRPFAFSYFTFWILIIGMVLYRWHRKVDLGTDYSASTKNQCASRELGSTGSKKCTDLPLYFLCRSCTSLLWALFQLPHFSFRSLSLYLPLLYALLSFTFSFRFVSFRFESSFNTLYSSSCFHFSSSKYALPWGYESISFWIHWIPLNAFWPYLHTSFSFPFILLPHFFLCSLLLFSSGFKISLYLYLIHLCFSNQSVKLIWCDDHRYLSLNVSHTYTHPHTQNSSFRHYRITDK